MNEKYYIYRFLDNKGDILYIGRTNNIERRILKEHFTKLGHLPKKCYKSIDKVEYTEIINESEEVAYEAILINKLSPPYNTQFKDEGDFDVDLPEFDWKEFEFKDEYYLKYLKLRKDKINKFEDVLLGVFSNLEEKLLEENNSIKTGFRDVDKQTDISSSDLILVGGDAGIGKTTYAINITLNLIKTNKKFYI